MSKPTKQAEGKRLLSLASLYALFHFYGWQTAGTRLVGDGISKPI